MLKPKVGDLVRLKPREIRRVNGAGDIECYVGGMNVLAYDNEVEEILPRPLTVGDRVQIRDQRDKDIIATVIGLDEEAAWLKWNTGRRERNSHRVVDLVRVDDPS